MMDAGAHKTIASRHLLYSRIGKSERIKFAVLISAPYLLLPGSVPFAFDEGTAACVIQFDGLPEEAITVYGADGIQALALAANIDPYLRGLARKYDFFWENGESYFDR